MQPETSSDRPNSGRDTEICSRPPEGCTEGTQHPSGSYKAISDKPTTNLRNQISAGLAALLAQEEAERAAEEGGPDTERTPGWDEKTDVARPAFDTIPEEED